MKILLIYLKKILTLFLSKEKTNNSDAKHYGPVSIDAQ